MNEDKLSKTLREHRQYLYGLPDGNRADLQDADLRYADLQGAVLRSANLQGANLQGADLRSADLQGADLRRVDLQGADLRFVDLRFADLQDADLRYANLQGADLQDADLKGADLDYSSWPLWCGSLDVKVDARIARQLAYHFCRLDCDDPEYKAARDSIKNFANKFHRVEECGEITGEKTKEAGKHAR